MSDLYLIRDIDLNNLQKLIASGEECSYRTLCKKLNLKFYSNRSSAQIKQLNELLLICDYEKHKSKYKIIRMRTEDEIMLYKERSVFTSLIEYCISEKILEIANKKNSNMQNDTLFLSTKTLILWCGIVNNNYNYIRTKHSRIEKVAMLSSQYGFDIKELYQFLNISYDQIFKPLVRNALKTMNNKRSVLVQKGFTVFNITDEGYYVYKNVLMTDTIGMEIENIVNEVRAEFNIDNDKSWFMIERNIKNKIYQKSNKLCYERLGYNGFYNCHAITINNYTSKYDLDLLRHDLNKQIQDKLMVVNSLENIRNAQKKKFIATMIDIDTTANFRYNIEKHH